MDKISWRVIPSTEGFYEASDAGEVRRVGKDRPLRPNHFGSIDYVAISIRGRAKSRPVHELVGEAWLGIPPQGFRWWLVDAAQPAVQDNLVLQPYSPPTELQVLRRRENARRLSSYRSDL